jgi:hypothetical protein
MAVETINYLPYTSKALYEAAIEAKRELVTSENLKWTSESPSDVGVAMLKVVSELGSLITNYVDNRVTQNYLIYAVNDEAVHATARQLGYVRKGAIASRIKILVTTNGAQTIPAGSKLEKTLEDGTKIKFELLDELIFTGAGSKYAYALQGETKYTTFTGDGTAYQKFVVPDYPIAYMAVIMAVGSTSWTQVDDFVDSSADSTHYMVEYDYVGQPTIYCGDGTYGKRPGNGAVVTVAYRLCDGAQGNVAPGEMSFVSRFAKVVSVTNEAPSKAELASKVSVTDTTIEVVDDGSISSFKDSGVAYIDDDSFTYTSIVGNVFQGVTGLENPHSEGDEVTYSQTYTYGQDRETNKETKVSAIRNVRMKNSANSLADYNYLVSKVPGVARSKSSVSYNTITIQIVPADGGIPSASLKEDVLEYMALRKNALHTLSITNPNYVYVDVTCLVTPAPGRNFTNDVKGKVITAIQNYLDPLKKDDGSVYYLNGWGNRLKKNLLEANIFELENRSLVADVEITVFKKSTEETGSSNIQLTEFEIAQIGSINVNRKDISFEIPAGDLGGPEGSESVPKMARVVV